MRIGLYSECLSRRHTGVETATMSLIEGLQSTGHELTLFHSRDPKHPAFSAVREHLFRKRLRIPLYNQFAAACRTSRAFNDVDILHMPSPQFPYLAQPRVPTVVTIHDVIPLILPKYHPYKRALFFKHILPRYLRRAKGIIAVSEVTRQDIMRKYRIPEDRISVVHNCLPAGEYSPGKKREDFILYVGTLEPRKNVNGLLKAFSILRMHNFPHRLVIAGGKGWDYAQTFKLIRRLGLEAHVDCRGYVGEDEKHDLYRRASLFAWPSFYEGFGLPVLEAMAHGTPVVTSNTSSLPEIVGDAGILVDPRRVEDIASGMMEALVSSEKRKKMSRAGIKRAKEFTPAMMVRATQAAYESVMR